jgi:hypothetical protein
MLAAIDAGFTAREGRMPGEWTGGPRVRRLLGRERSARIDQAEASAVRPLRALRLLLRSGCAIVTAAAATIAAAAPPGPLVTIVEGAATVLDSRRLLAAAAGLAVPPQAIVETGPDSRLMRIEWPDGRALNLGPGTRVMVEPPGFAARGKPAPAIYLLQGWAKVAAPSKGQVPALVSPQVQVAGVDGVVVLRVDDTGSRVFVQAGRASVVERNVRSPQTWALAAGALLERETRGQGTLHGRASSAQLRDVPRTFRDTLPARYAAASALKPEPTELGAPTYDRLQPWMTAERSARSGFVPRFARLLRDRDFRRGVDANLAAHPEWRPILYPPPPPPPPSAPAPRPAAR